MVTRTKLHICHGHLQHCNPNYALQTSRAKFPKVQTALLLHVLGWDWIVVAVPRHSLDSQIKASANLFNFERSKTVRNTTSPHVEHPPPDPHESLKQAQNPTTSTDKTSFQTRGTPRTKGQTTNSSTITQCACFRLRSSSSIMAARDGSK